MTNNPLVSVLGTSYLNSLFQIKRCLISLKKQTYKNLEYIFVLEPKNKNNIFFYKLTKKLNIKTRIILNKKKLGFVKSLNKGIKFCKGKYICRVDFDDYYSKNKIIEQVAVLEKNPKIGVCGTGLYLFNKKKFFIKIFPKKNFFIKIYFFLFNSVAHSSVIIRKSILNKYGKYNEKFIYAEDLELWLRLLSKKVKFYNIKKCLTFYSIEKKNFVRNRENFFYNLQARKIHSKKIYGKYIGIINEKIFQFFVTNYIFIFKLLKKISKNYE